MILLDGQLKNLSVDAELMYFETLRMLTRKGYLIICTHTELTIVMIQ
jgi:hypothetical protein